MKLKNDDEKDGKKKLQMFVLWYEFEKFRLYMIKRWC